MAPQRSRSRQRPKIEEQREEYFFQDGSAAPGEVEEARAALAEIRAEKEEVPEGIPENSGDREDEAASQEGEAENAFHDEEPIPGADESVPDGKAAVAERGEDVPDIGGDKATELAEPAGGFVKITGSAREVARDMLAPLCRLNYMVPAACLLFALMFSAIAFYVITEKDEAVSLLEKGPAEAYDLMAKGENGQARRLWVQINARAKWYMPSAGLFFTDIDQPYLQKSALAFQAEAWDDVVENAYKALNVPITDQQAVYVQQMILTATANKVRAYLPDQESQPIKGGIPEHAAPVCDPASAWIWVVPAFLLILATVCLYGRMRILFICAALAMPLYFWGVSSWNQRAQGACEARLAFNPSHIELYGTSDRMVQSTSAFRERSGHSFKALESIPKEPVKSFVNQAESASLPAQEITLPQGH